MAARHCTSWKNPNKDLPYKPVPCKNGQVHLVWQVSLPAGTSNLRNKFKKKMATNGNVSSRFHLLRSDGHFIQKQKNFLDFHVETQQFSSDDGGNDTASLSMTWEQCKYRLPTPNSTFHFKRSHFPPAPHNWRENLFSPPKLKTRNPTRSTFHSGGTFQHFVQKYSLLFFWSKW